jgi:phosphomannomutase
MNIVFGTDGWRARIAEEYTFDAVRVCAQSVAEWVQKSGEADRGVVIGYDRRFASEHFAAAAAEVVAAHGIHVFLSTAAAPTQSFSYATMRKKAKAGIVITASHNPWPDNGFKVKSETGPQPRPTCSKSSRQSSGPSSRDRRTCVACRSMTRRPRAISSSSIRRPTTSRGSQSCSISTRSRRGLPHRV